MSIKDKYTVKPIARCEWLPFVRDLHYAKRVPMVSHAFGLFDHALRACVTYGGNANGNLNNFLGYPLLELNRLIALPGLEKNCLSLLVGASLKMVDYACTIISYADTTQGHHGYIYQATNWIYTGVTAGDVEFEKDGKQYHRKKIYDTFGTGSMQNAIDKGFSPVVSGKKHRYFYFIGSKKQKKEMMTLLPYPTVPYPKGENFRYDDSAKIKIQNRLFD